MTRPYLKSPTKDLDFTKLSEFNNLRGIKKGASNPRRKYLNVENYFSKQGWREGLHWIDIGPVPSFDTSASYSRFAANTRYHVAKAVGEDFQISLATGRVFVFKTAQPTVLETSTGNQARVPSFSTEDSSNKRAIVDPYFTTVPSTEGLAVCLPNFYTGPTESDIHRLLRAGFPKSRILAVERDRAIYENLRMQTKDRIRVINDDVESVVAEETEPISLYYPDYCGFFNQASVRGLEALSGKLTDSARVMTTFCRGHDNGDYRKPFLDKIWSKIFAHVGLDMRLEALAEPSSCVWVTLFVSQCLGMSLSDILKDNTLTIPKTGYKLKVQGFHRYTGIGNQGMEFAVIDLHKVSKPLDYFPEMLGDLVGHVTSLVLQGSS